MSLKFSLVKIILTISVLLLSVNQSLAQTDENYKLNFQEDADKKESLWDLFKYDASAMVGGVGFAYSRPFHWKEDDLLVFGGVAATTIALYSVDNETSRYFVDQGEDIPQVIKDYGFYYGSPQNNYFAIGAVYLTGLFTKSEKVRRVGVLLIASATAGGILQQFSKYAVGRARPQEIADRNVFKPFNAGAGSGFSSFPSGHTVLSITNAHIVAKLFKNPWIKGGIYAIGAIPPLTRLWDGAHWLTDITLSSAISIAIVEAVDKFLDKKYETKLTKGPDESNDISWSLKLAPGQLGVSVTF